MTRRFLLNLLAYVVPTFLLGFVWHMVLFTSYYRDLGIYRADPIVPLGLGSMLLQGVVFAYAYPRLVASPGSIAGGLRFAAVAALLSWTFTTLAVAAKYPMASIAGYIAIESAFTAMQFLMVGPLLALTSRDVALRVAPAAS